MLSSNTTPKEPIMITNDKIKKHINWVVTAIDIYLFELVTGNSSDGLFDTIQSNTSSGSFPTL